MARPTYRALRACTLVTIVALASAGCLPSGSNGSTSSNSQETNSSQTVRVVVHDSFALSDELIASFEKSSGYSLELVTNGDGGTLVNKLVLTKDEPLGDVAYGVDNTYGSRALEAGVFEEYTPKNESERAQQLRIPGDNTLAPIDYGDVCLNQDLDYFGKIDLKEPLEKDGFFNPAHAGDLVVTNPATSSPGLSFLLATIAKYGEEGYLDYWKELKSNGLKIVDGWEDAYYVDFSATGDGDKPLVLSYASSPAFTVAEGESRSTTAALMSTCYRQVEYAGVLTNASNPEGARAFIDFLQSSEFQQTIAENLYMYPLAEGVELPKDWAQYAPVPEQPLSLDPADINEKREQWIKDWSAEILG